MTMRGRTALIAVAITMLAGFVMLVGHEWLAEHDARLKAEAQTGQQQKQIDTLTQQEAGAQAALQAKLASFDRQRTRPATAAQLVSDTTALLPGLPEKLLVKSSPVNPALPDGPSTQTIVVPEADFKSIRDAELSCEEDSAKLTACQTAEADGKQQLKLAEAQRDEWKKAAKGGSVWHRALGAAKWFAVGAGTGAVVYAVGHHK